MKHVSLFENFINIPDREAIEKILSVSEEPWFISGEDAPDEFRDSFLETISIKDPEIEEDIDICIEGPGYTDMMMDSGELISDILMEEPDVTEEEIYDSNKVWFANERERIVKDFRKLLTLGRRYL